MESTLVAVCVCLCTFRTSSKLAPCSGHRTCMAGWHYPSWCKDGECPQWIVSSESWTYCRMTHKSGSFCSNDFYQSIFTFLVVFLENELIPPPIPHSPLLADSQNSIEIRIYLRHGRAKARRMSCHLDIQLQLFCVCFAMLQMYSKVWTHNTRHKKLVNRPDPFGHTAYAKSLDT